MTWAYDYVGGVCCTVDRHQGMPSDSAKSANSAKHRSKMESSRSNRGLFLDLYLRTVTAGQRGRQNELDPWHQSMSRMNGHNPPPLYHGPTESQQDTKITKKDKPKWSLGGFFRRRKKEDSDSSSGCEQNRTGNTTKKGFLSRRSRNKRQNATGRLGGAFDHVVVTGREHQNNSDHSNGSNATGDLQVRSSRESLASTGTGSLEGHHRRRKERVKARAEALRHRLKNNSSSDEDEASPGNSSVSRFRSEDSLHGSLPRRARRHTTKKQSKDEGSTYSLNTSIPHLRNSYSSSSVAYSAPSISKLRDEYSTGYDDGGVMHVQLPIGIQHRSRISKAPPPPPPRDPNRKYLNSQYDNSRPLSYAFENDERNPGRRSQSSSRLAPSQNERCNSEDHIAIAEQWRSPVYMPDRPSSVSVEAMRPQVKRFITRHPSANDVDDGVHGGRYKYFADQTPRSRKPILATPFVSDNNYEPNVSKIYHPPPTSKEHKSVRSASDFWKMKDQEEASRRKQANSTTAGQMRSYKSMENQNNLALARNIFPRCAVRDIPLKSEPVTRRSPVEVKKREPPVPPQRKYTPNRTSSGSSAGECYETYNGFENVTRPKSRNLEDALSELEAIYKSLKLSDEDLLDRAERLDVTTPVFDKKSRIADRSCPLIPHVRLNRRSTIPDKIADDMAYRRLHPKDRQPSQESTSPQISYLLGSPLASRTFEYNTMPPEQDCDEPNITLDDVVYRNVRQANHSLKVKEPQPPFGIPLGPVVPGANSDYLHAAPKNAYRPRFMPRKSPDIVSDDLAYRNLRKDQNKNSALPPIKPINDDLNLALSNLKQEDVTNTAKKKRAVRSMSANVYNLLHQHMQSLIDDDEQDFEKAQSLSNVSENGTRAQSKTLPPGAKLVVSDTEVSQARISRSPTSTETLTNSRNDMTSLAKLTSELEDDYLTALAQRAKDATEKIDQELRELRGEVACTKELAQKDQITKDSNSEVPILDKNELVIIETPKPLNNILVDLDQISEQAKQCQDKLAMAVDEQTKEEPKTYCLEPTIDSGNTTEQSDIENVDIIDNSENLVFTSVSSLLEKSSGAEDSILDGPKFSDLTEKCKFQLGALQDFQNDADYDNVPSTVLEFTKNVSETESPRRHTAPIGSEMKHKKSLLKNMNDEIIEDISIDNRVDTVARRMNDINANETKINEITDSIQNNILSISELLQNCDDTKRTYKPVMLNKNFPRHLDKFQDSIASSTNSCTPEDNSPKYKKYTECKEDNLGKSSDDSDTPDYANVPRSKSKSTAVPLAELDEDTSEYNSAEELAMIFGKEDSKSKSTSPICGSPELNVTEDKGCAKAVGDSGKFNSEGSSAGNGFSRQHASDSSGGMKLISDNQDQNAPPMPWYCDPRQLLIICAYGLACVQQFSGLDLFVLLSILLAVISVIAMLII